MQHVPPYTYCSLFSVALCRASFVPLAEHTQHSRYCSRQNISILMCFDKAWSASTLVGSILWTAVYFFTFFLNTTHL